MKKSFSILFTIFLAALSVLTTAARPHSSEALSRPSAARQQHPVHDFPEIPETLRTPEERATYLSLHFWDTFDFTADPAAPGTVPRDGIEQAFVDFISVLPMSSERHKALASFMRASARNPELFRYFMELADKYLYEPASPMHDDEMYMYILNAAVKSRAPKAEKVRPRWQLAKMKMNAVGKKAEDFEYMDGDAAKTLRKTEGEYVLVFFHDPECRDCRFMKVQLDASEEIQEMVADGRMKIVSVGIDNEDKMLYYSELYDLRAFPALYLLDARKRVLLKNASVAEVENEL